MSSFLKLLIVAGARPNFMKVAPLIKAAQSWNARVERLAPPVTDSAPLIRFECRLVHTGQHYDEKMSHIFFQELGIPAPDVNLEVGSGSHAVQTANIMARFEPVLLQQPPDWVIVVGDVNSTMACTLVAAKLHIQVAHVEAGLRSFDRTMPEEINRIVTDSIANLLLTPSEDANENLKREGVPAERIRLVGNIMIDALVENLPKAHQTGVLGRLGVERRNFAYVTLHRPSNVDERSSLTAIVSELKKLARQVPVVFPIHPRTRIRLTDFGLSCNGSSALKVLEPVGYHESLSLAENARFILTDSGGLQEESTFFHTPCLTLRPNTERPVTITQGTNKLTRLETLSEDISQMLNGPKRPGKVPDLWDGQTAQRIVQALLEHR